MTVGLNRVGCCKRRAQLDPVPQRKSIPLRNSSADQFVREASRMKVDVSNQAVESRFVVGQILEACLGYASDKLNKAKGSCFAGISHGVGAVLRNDNLKSFEDVISFYFTQQPETYSDYLNPTKSFGKVCTNGNKVLSFLYLHDVITSDDLEKFSKSWADRRVHNQSLKNLLSRNGGPFNTERGFSEWAKEKGLNLKVLMSTTMPAREDLNSLLNSSREINLS